MLVYHGEFDTHLAAASALDNKVTRLLGADDNPDAILPTSPRGGRDRAVSLSYPRCVLRRTEGYRRYTTGSLGVLRRSSDWPRQTHEVAGRHRGITDQMEGIYAMERLAVGAPSRGGRVADRTRLQ